MDSYWKSDLLPNLGKSLNPLDNFLLSIIQSGPVCTVLVAFSIYSESISQISRVTLALSEQCCAAFYVVTDEERERKDWAAAITRSKIHTIDCVLSFVYTKDQLNDSQSIWRTVAESPLVKPQSDQVLFVLPKAWSNEDSGEIAKNPLICNKLKFTVFAYVDSASVTLQAMPSMCKNKLSDGVNFYNVSIIGNNTEINSFFPDFATNLHASKLRLTCVATAIPIQIRTVNGTNVPYETGGQYLRTALSMCESLNATCELIKRQSVGSQDENGTWGEGLINDLLTKEAEVGVVGGISLSRIQAVDFSTSFVSDTVTFVHGLPRPVYNWKNIFRPWSLQVWMANMFSAAITLASLKILKMMSIGRRPALWSCAESVEFVVGTYLLQFHKRPKPVPTRMFVPWWYAFVVVMTTAYSAQLYGSFVRPPVEPTPSTFQELGRSQYSIGFTYFGGVLREYFKNSKNGSFERNIFFRMEKMTVAECHLLAAKKTRFACIAYTSMSNSQAQTSFGPTWKKVALVRSRGYVMPINIALMFPKGSFLTSAANPIIARVTAGGFLDYWTHQTNYELREEIREKGELLEKHRAVNNNQPSAIDFKHITYIFQVTCFLLGICFATFITEILANVAKRRYDNWRLDQCRKHILL